MVPEQSHAEQRGRLGGEWSAGESGLDAPRQRHRGGRVTASNRLGGGAEAGQGLAERLGGEGRSGGEGRQEQGRGREQAPGRGGG